MTTLDTIKTLTIKATTDGVDDATKSMNSLATSYGNVAVASDTTTKSTTIAAASYNKLQGQLDPAYRAATQLSNAQTLLGKSFDQGLVSVDRYNQLMALASQRFDDAGKKASPFAVALSGVKTQMVALSAGLGPVGTGLAAFGPIGLAVGVGLAAVAAGFDALKDQANEAGQWAQTLTQAAAIIGLNTTQIQALNEAAAQVGVSANDNVSAFEKFSVALGQLKDGSGTLYTELSKVNPQLVSQLSVTKDSATAWNLLAQAYAAANAQQQALITRAAFGRGGAAEGQVLSATATAGGISGLTSENQANSISQQQIAQWALLTTQINSATEAASHNFQSVFTTQILTSEKSFADTMLSISQFAKEFALSDDFRSLLDFIKLSGAVFSTTIAAMGAFSAPARSAASSSSSLFGNDFGANFNPSHAAEGPRSPSFSSGSSSTLGSPGDQATRAKELVSALGSAATAQDKLDAATKQLAVDLAGGKITLDTYNKALGGAQLDAAIAKQSTQNKSLGASPGACELAAVVERVGKSGVPKENRTPALINQDEKRNVGDEYNLPAAA